MAEEKELVLLDFWVSPFGQRCRIAMAEKGLEFEYREEDLGNKSDLLLRSNPVHRKIPVLLHAGRPVSESLVILQYLDDAFPGTPHLLPPANSGDADAAYARATARFWADYVDRKLYDCGSRLWRLKGEPQAAAGREMAEILRTLEAELGDREFFGGGGGGRLGFVDVALVPFTAWFYSYERCGGFSVEEVAPRLAAWARRCGRIDSVAKHLPSPEKVYDFVGVLKKKYGVE
ncbi:probable glutathione S-transferase GSTU1 [Oryza glaberrima]|uniref:Glutathione S-transferase n=2 Tax=Oryza TaxID=4527 RepID=A0A0D3FPX5_9ORYZ|nr:probable glutathione S-transferase GSTU1 [Oryza glaberrima]